MTSEVRRVRARFADDNPLLYLSLGLLSSFDTLERLLAAHAPERSRPGPAPAPAPAPAPIKGSDVEMEAVHFVLGLIALRARIGARLGETAAPASAPSPTTAPSGGGLEEGSESLWR